VLTDGKPGEIYNIGSGVEASNAEITRRLVELCDADQDLVQHVEDRKGHDLRYSVDTEKIRRLGYRPAVEFDAGLASAVEWYRNNAWWWKS
jgi:dTDP-glucose 4,6-dehydratase